jgi:hypothetical protein
VNLVSSHRPPDGRLDKPAVSEHYRRVAMEIHQLRYFVAVAEDPPSPRLRRDERREANINP